VYHFFLGTFSILLLVDIFLSAGHIVIIIVDLIILLPTINLKVKLYVTLTCIRQAHSLCGYLYYHWFCL